MVNGFFYRSAAFEAHCVLGGPRLAQLNDEEMVVLASDIPVITIECREQEPGGVANFYAMIRPDYGLMTLLHMFWPLLTTPHPGAFSRGKRNRLIGRMHSGLGAKYVLQHRGDCLGSDMDRFHG